MAQSVDTVNTLGHTSFMTQTWAALRTRPTAFQSEATTPQIGPVRVALLMWKLQARRVRSLA
jgi:hypothetical protein